MHIHLIVIGIIFIVLALIHIIFPKYFEWEKEFRSLSLINRQIMKVHTIFIALTVFLMGLLCLTSANELIETNLGKKIIFGLAIFWTARLIIQFFGYSSKLWKGKLFETTVHIIFSMLWIYISFVFWIIYFIH
ncbi:MAG: hypothetical protein K0R77_1692 [Chryseobacterium sp.]|jgi:hypothetical protein|uniref:hypothetical protein n=1 Tax=Chryseobacterium sp. TaxID=1871047 RepID=UPI0026289F01|nr:hypothetical protein [Chryseobacterium sp.]MDF2552417.1 hypothetical protein [Chryseobacterium sp.]